MKRFLTLLTSAFICLALFSTTVDARRLGGGGNFGKQRAIPHQAQKAPAPAQPAPASAPNRNRWLGPLAGLAIGAGLASIFAGHGLGGDMMGSLLLLLLVAGGGVWLMSRLNKAQQPAMQYAGSIREPVPENRPTFGGTMSAPMSMPSSIPHDFPLETFLRNGKTSFIRLQAANDRKDLDDIREYTTPEMFAEISMQIRERGEAVQKTDVVSIDAELVEVANEGDYQIASVRFVAQLRENNGMLEDVDEVWHVQKNLRDPNAVWLLAGIQQSVPYQQ